MSETKSKAIALDVEDEEVRGWKRTARSICTNTWFELGITLVIIINSLLIGVETYHSNTVIELVQTIILYIFTMEIALRFVASSSVRSFFCDGCNLFDLFLVLLGYPIPRTHRRGLDRHPL